MTLSERRLRRLFWWTMVFVVVGNAATIVLEVVAGRPDETAFSVLLLTFPVVGFFVVGRRPDALLGWLMVAMGVGAALFGVLTGYGAYAVTHDLSYGPVALALGGPGWVPFIGISGYLLLLFPDGHLPSPRWRWFSWTCGVALSLVVVFIWFYPGDFADSGFPDIENPLGIDALAPFLDGPFGLLLYAAPLLVVGGFVNLVVRMRRTSPISAFFCLVMSSANRGRASGAISKRRS